MKILISRPDKIGDVILALHGIKQLKLLKPEVKVFIHISEYTRNLVENVKFIDGIVATEEEIRAGKFDVTIDLMAKYRTAKQLATAKAKYKIGNSARAHSILYYNLTRYLRRSKALINEAEYNWQLISLIDDQLKHSRLVEKLSLSDFKKVDEYTKHDDYMVLMPSITASAESWELESWFETARLLSNKNPEKQIIFLLGPAEKDLEEKLILEFSDQDQISVEKFKTFSEVIGFLKKASFYVGTSTGITHLASSVIDNGLALYPEKQSMHPRRWMPFDSKFDCVSLSRKPMPANLIDIDSQYNPLSREKISAFIICCNEEANIRRALESVKWCDEIVVVDSGSKDKTLDICKEYTDKIYHRDWTGNRDQKQFALEKCSYNWIVNIDADEEVSMELRGSIIKILSNPKRAAKGYNVCRLIYYLDKWWDRGGWFPEYRLRFFQKEHVEWGGNDPHEKAVLKGRAKKINGFIYHYTYQDVQHQVTCLQKHASMMAQSLQTSGRKARLFNVFLNPLFRFFKFYILKKGFLEGIPGIIVAIQESYYTFLKYLILWEKNRKQKVVK